jgi:hypothetical protein
MFYLKNTPASGKSQPSMQPQLGGAGRLAADASSLMECRRVRPAKAGLAFSTAAAFIGRRAGVTFYGTTALDGLLLLRRGGAVLFVNSVSSVTPKLHYLCGKAGAQGAPQKAREMLSVFLKKSNTVPPK